MSVDRILVVEDDERIGSALARALEGNGFDVRWTRSGEDAVASVEARRPDLVLLDLGLPDMDGLEVCRRVHAADSTIDVIMLNARDEELDVVVGLDAGAIDYITKPFKLAELLARVRAQLRRNVPRSTSRSTSGDLDIDPGARRVWLRGTELDLRATESSRSRKAKLAHASHSAFHCRVVNRPLSTPVRRLTEPGAAA